MGYWVRVLVAWSHSVAALWSYHVYTLSQVGVKSWYHLRCCYVSNPDIILDVGVKSWYHLRCCLNKLCGALLWRSMVQKHAGRWKWQWASVISWSWERRPCQNKLVSAQSMPLLFVLSCLVSYNGAQLFKACDCLKPVSFHFDLCVDATGVVCHRLGLLDQSRGGQMSRAFASRFGRSGNPKIADSSLEPMRSVRNLVKSSQRL